MDTFLAIMVNAAVSVGCCWLGWEVTRRASPRFAVFLMPLAFVLLLIASFGLRDRLFWALLFPLATVSALCNPVSPAAGFLAGVAGQRLGRTRRRKIGVTGLLGVLGFIAAYCSDLSPMPEIAPKSTWVDDVLQQTSPATCGAASAVTLLHSVGIATTEREMAQLCHTTTNGTAMLSLLHGLDRMTTSTPWKTVAVTTDDPAELKRLAEKGPILLSVLFQPVSNDRVNRFQSAVNAHHAVVLFGFRPDGSAEIGDPLSGRSLWSLEELRQRWPGEGIRIQKR